MINSKTDALKFKPDDGKKFKKSRVSNQGLKGLYLVCRVTSSGALSKSWRFISNGSDLTLGTFPRYSLEDARSWATGMWQRINAGFVPDNAPDLPKSMDALFIEFVNQHDVAESTKKTLKSIWRVHVSNSAIGKASLTSLKQPMVVHHAKQMGITVSTVRYLQTVKAMMAYANVHYGIQPIILPTAGVIFGRKKAQSVISPKRFNILEKSQFKELWRICSDSWDPVDQIIAWTMLTGARKSEAIGCRFSEIKDGVWTLPAERTKTKVERAIPLTTQLKKILERNRWRQIEGELVFGSVGAATVSQRCERYRPVLENNFTCHDLRRSFAHFAGQAVDPFIADLMIGHAPVGTSKSFSIYQPEAFKQRVRTGWDEWQNWVDTNL
ncbi:tyrosine-type recombinase/integrase [Erwiniaceae bacterium BAC15a-03b]|uniref:Tyrosine-type recombinase/integrase n=1 Tax=Winslowiella arboricola TaxID=2978220 RepID=A0A9J6PV63_9GAMM|nr:tyrosine-type recombinase/integrase [Winslowiella arboricola]MCU5775741.1 tyrosine-type recombinase/integrase [Winslowiella arboricola]MCU5779408.1 tyrosine-type recombinase/integrase [Winslowiella arboricola]